MLLHSVDHACTIFFKLKPWSEIYNQITLSKTFFLEDEVFLYRLMVVSPAYAAILIGKSLPYVVI